MWEFAPFETHPAFPVLLVLDTSASMAGEPMEVISAALPALRGVIGDDPRLAEIVRLAIITFADAARVLVPLSDVVYARVPRLSCGAGTNFGAAFRVARRELQGGIRALGKGTQVHPPVVFFVSDGRHDAAEDWTGALDRLRDPDWRFRPEIVALGVGNASLGNLRRIASRTVCLVDTADRRDRVPTVVATIVGTMRTRMTASPSGLLSVI